MSNKAYYFGDANAIARLMKKMYFGVETEVPVYEEREVTTTKQLSVANLGDFFEVTTNTPTSDPWKFADTGTAEVRMAGLKKGSTQYGLTLTAKRALTGVSVDAEYYFSGMYGNISISIANTTVLSKSLSNENKAKMNYWTGTLAAGDTINISGNHMMSSTSATPLVSVYVTCDGISTTTIEQVQVGTETKELARKVIRAYQPDANGKAQLWFDADAAGTSVTFTGTHTISDITIDGKAYKLMTMTGSGTLTVKGGEVQYWMCGGGAGGGAGIVNSSTSFGGRGGGGGFSAAGALATGEYVVQIASGGQTDANGSDTILGSVTAKGGYTNGNGGSGGGAQVCAGYHAEHSKSETWVETAGTGAGTSTYPFGVSGLYAHCAGGASGSAFYKGRKNSTSYRIYGCNGGTNGGNGSSKAYTTADDPQGGVKGGGNGAVTGNGGNGTFYGAGAGGGAAYRSSGGQTEGPGGAGYQGVAYVLVPVA